MQEYIESQGKQFAFTIAPNKNSIYPLEHMPDYIENRHGESNAARIGAYLDTAGVITSTSSKSSAVKKTSTIRRTLTGTPRRAYFWPTDC